MGSLLSNSPCIVRLGLTAFQIPACAASDVFGPCCAAASVKSPGLSSAQNPKVALALTPTAAAAITSRCRSKGGAICTQTLPHYPGQFQWRACRALRATYARNLAERLLLLDRKSTRLNSSHLVI